MTEHSGDHTKASFSRKNKININLLSKKAVKLMLNREFESAKTLFLKLIEFESKNENNYAHLGWIFLIQKNYDQSILMLEKSVDINPTNVDTLNNLGIAYQNNGAINKSVQILNQALQYQPNHPKILYNIANTFRISRKYTDSIKYYKLAIYNQPDYPKALLNLSICLIEINRIHEANYYLTKAYNLNPTSSDVLSCYGNLYFKRKNITKAIEFFIKSLEVDSSNKDTCINLASLYNYKGEYNNAIRYYKKAIKLDPKCSLSKLSLANVERTICIWNTEIQQQISDIPIKALPLDPFLFYPFETDPSILLSRAQNYYSNRFSNKSTTNVPFTNNSKIRIGYFSANFYDHPVMHLLCQVLELHDKTKFEIYTYSLRDIRTDSYTKRVIKISDRYNDISALDDIESSNLARGDSLDLAIDLMGYTQEHRMPIFSSRVAPVQISFLGYPGTSGSECMDYLIADNYLIPDEFQKFYSEQILYMPDCYQCNDSSVKPSGFVPIRSKYGLPNDKFVFACFNASYKISKREFDVWLKLLFNIDNSVIWILATNLAVKKNLLKEAQLRGISSNRLFFAERVPSQEHMNRHSCANLFLDTFSYNAGATAFFSLRSGLPLLTLSGETYTSRMAGSLLNTLGMEELIACSVDEYFCKAYRLATDHKYLANVKIKLKIAIQKSSLFDSIKYTRDLEELYRSTIKTSD